MQLKSTMTRKQAKRQLWITTDGEQYQTTINTISVQDPQKGTTDTAYFKKDNNQLKVAILKPLMSCSPK